MFDTQHPKSPSLTMEDSKGSDVPIASVDPLAAQSNTKKNILLGLFSLAQFLDLLGVSTLFTAIPAISEDVGLSNSESVWMIGAYSLAFASLLLISGRMSDIYNPKHVFLVGLTPLGLLAIGLGFVRNKIALLVLRGLSGATASLTIPSALHLIVHLFPDPKEQARAVTVYGGFGTIGSTIGILIGGLCVSYASWPWIFWIIAMIAIPLAALCASLIPRSEKRTEASEDTQSLDVVGVTTLTLALVLFIFAVTSGSADGWGSARVIVPLVVSLILILAFFVWEAKIPEKQAALPPRIWRYQNIILLTVVAFLPYTWWASSYLLFAWLWQEVYHWSAIMTAVRFIPMGLLPLPFMMICRILQQKFPTKLLLLWGLSLMMVGTILFPFADRPSRYWSFAFPGSVIGTAGTTLVFTVCNVTMFAVTPPKIAGIVGAVFNSSLQLGVAVFTAAVTSIQTSVQDSPVEYKGRAAAFWFLFALTGVEALMILVFFKAITVGEVGQVQHLVEDNGEAAP